MKKVFLLVILVLLALNGYSQGFKSVVVKGGFQTNWNRPAISAEGRYYFTDNFRIAPEVTYYFTNKHTNGLDLSVNANYLIKADEGLNIYPMVGISVINNRTKIPGSKANGETDFGFNLGAGCEYSLSESVFLNLDAKYVFNDFNCVVILAGFGYRFNL